MSVEPPGPPAAPKASAAAPRAGSGPKRPPRPERKAPASAKASEAPKGTSTGFATVSAPAAATAVAERGPVTAPPTAQTAAVPTAATVPAASSSTGRRRTRRGRRVKRVLRRIDLWSVLKLSLVVYTCLYVSVLATLAALWGILYQSGNVDKLQSFLGDVGLENFTFYGNQMFRACAAIGAVGVLAGTVITVLATALINIISEMTGGIRLIVIEEDVDR
ncbi:MAG: hypothetical protein JWO77_1256 [Ilumatobacteraceae bacterium]|nr:hypothetical protein [Ilumatobacteraceae bacterium]